jgi:hypothetical protein
MLYTIDFFHQLMKDESLTFTLSPNVLDILQQLDKEVEIPEFTVTQTSSHHFHGKNEKTGFSGSHNHNSNGYGGTSHGLANKNGGSGMGSGDSSGKSRDGTDQKRKGSNKRNKKEYSGNGTNEEDWDLARSFKATVIEKKNGIEKIMDDIRINMNKMSNTTYEKQKEVIAELIHGYFNSPADFTDENTQKLSEMVLQISSGNKFYSALYADLYGYLISLNPVFRNKLDLFIAEFDKNIENIVYVDPNVNYDEYCNYIKANEHRQAVTTFFVNLMKKGLIDEVIVLNIIRLFLNIVIKYVDEANKTKEVEEITENISILYMNSKTQLCEYKDTWNDIEADIHKFSQSYSKEYLSLSNRAIFKFMDMIESD